MSTRSRDVMIDLAPRADFDPSANGDASDRVSHASVRSVRVPPRLEHQPALDGLRGLAVIAVMVYHQGHLGGGFLGVDVFFVLSGFLITSLLLIDHARTGKVVSLGFWRRRARRLLPAMLCLLVIESIYAITIARPQDVEPIRHGAIATLLYVQNYWILRHPGDFLSPINHTWSLSIEEQFYLAWPLLLALLVRWTHRTRWLVAVILALAGVSALLMVAYFLNHHSTGWAYGATETRAHELLIGAALGVALLRRGPRRSGIVLEIAGVIALVGLVVAVMTANPYEPFLYKGGFLLIAVATAVLIAACTAAGSTHLRAVLGWKPLTAIGLISYGLYLYHVPLFDFVNAQHIVTWEPARVVMRFAFVGIVAFLSYLLIEKPIRRGALSSRQLRVLTPVAIVCVVAVVMVSTAGAQPPEPYVLQAVVFANARRETPNGSDRVLVAGDSLASSFVSTDQPTFQGSHVEGVAEWAAACDLLGGSIVVGLLVLPQPDCHYANSYLSGVATFQPDVSVLTLGPTVVFDRIVDGRRLAVGTPEYRRFLFKRLDALRAALTWRKATLLITTVPCMTPPTVGPYAGFAAVQRDAARVAAVNQDLRAYARQNDVSIADLGQLLCAHPAYLSAGGATLEPSEQATVWKWLAPIARDAREHDQADR